MARSLLFVALVLGFVLPACGDEAGQLEPGVYADGLHVAIADGRRVTWRIDAETGAVACADEDGSPVGAIGGNDCVWECADGVAVLLRIRRADDGAFLSMLEGAACEEPYAWGVWGVLGRYRWQPDISYLTRSCPTPIVEPAPGGVSCSTDDCAWECVPGCPFGYEITSEGTNPTGFWLDIVGCSSGETLWEEAHTYNETPAAFADGWQLLIGW